jgi:hypothetical protein
LPWGGYHSVQFPAGDHSWDFEDVGVADIVARSQFGRNVVTSYDAGPYHAYYISYMPEYQHGEYVEAAQWLYNAIVCTPGPISVDPASWAEIKAGYR